MSNNINILLMTSKSWAGFSIAPPMGLYRLKNLIEKHGHKCDILDFDIDDDTEYKNKTKNGYYDVIGMSITHVNLEVDLDTIYEFKSICNNKTLFVSGGQESTLNSKQILDTGLVDISFLGFCENEFLSFCNNLASLNIRDLNLITKDIDSIAFYNDAKYIYKPAQRLTYEKFVELSYTNVMNSFVPYQKYWDIVAKKRVDGFNNAKFIIETVRLYVTSHCPKKCGFCSSQNFLPISQDTKSNKLTMLEASHIYDIIEYHIKEYNTKAFMFSDDEFVMGNRQGITRVFDFCKLIIEAKKSNKIPNDIEFFCQARLDDFIHNRPNETFKIEWDLLYIMKEAGFQNIGMGIETFSDRLLNSKSIHKIGVNSKQEQKGVEAMLKVGITPQLFIILGIPESEIKDLIYSINLAAYYLLQGADIAVIADMYSYPGSPIYFDDSYDVTFSNWTSPINNKTIKINQYIRPFNQKIANAVRKVDNMTNIELQRISKEQGWNDDSIMPKSLVSMVKFNIISELLDDKESRKRFESIVQSLLNNVDEKTILETYDLSFFKNQK